MTTHTRIILITGHAGTGKTTLGHAIAQRTGGALLDKDTMFSHFVHKMLLEAGEYPHDRDSAYYTTVIREREYASLGKTISDNIGVCPWVIAVAPWTNIDLSYMTSLKDMWENQGASVHIVWVDAPEEVQRANITSRGLFQDKSKLSDWGGYQSGLNTNPAPLQLADFTVENTTVGLEGLDNLKHEAGLIVEGILDN